MTFAEELKKTRQHSFLSQGNFAKEVNVSFSTVNRWENGKTKPNLVAMKNIKAFCERNSVDFSKLEKLWLSTRTEDKQHD